MSPIYFNQTSFDAFAQTTLTVSGYDRGSKVRFEAQKLCEDGTQVTAGAALDPAQARTLAAMLIECADAIDAAPSERAA